MISRIKYYIAIKGMTEKGFGASLGLSQQLIHHYMSGRNRMPVEVVMRILEKYPEISAEWLLRGEGDYKKRLHESDVAATMTKVYEELLSDRDKRIRELEMQIAEKKLGAG